MVNMTHNRKLNFSHVIKTIVDDIAPYSGLEENELKLLSSSLRTNWIDDLDPLSAATSH